MNFKKPNSASVQNTATLLVGVVVGAMAGRAGYGAIQTAPTGTAEEIKTKKLIEYGKRGALALASGFGAAGITGNDTASLLAKGALMGLAGIQIIDGVKDAAGESAAAIKLTTGSKAQKAIAKGLGLQGCGCDGTNAPVVYNAVPMLGVRKRKGLKGPGMVLDANNGGFEGSPISSPYQTAAIKGAQLSY